MEDRDTKALLPSHSANGYAESIPRRSGATTRRRGYSVEYFAEEYRGDSEGYRGNYSAEEYSSECSADDGGGGRTHCPARAEADPDGKGDEAGAPPRRRWRRRREGSGTCRGKYSAEEWHRDYSAEEFRGDSEEYCGEYSAE